MELIEDCIARGLSCQDLWELWLHRHQSGTSPGATSHQGSSRTWLCHSLESLQQSGQQWDGEIATRGTERKSQVSVAPVCSESLISGFALPLHSQDVLQFCSSFRWKIPKVGQCCVSDPAELGFAGCVLSRFVSAVLPLLSAASPACPDLIPALGPAGSSAFLWINPTPAEPLQSCFHQHSHIWTGHFLQGHVAIHVCFLFSLAASRCSPPAVLARVGS